MTLPEDVFRLTLDGGGSALLRVLDVFAVQGARLVGVEMREAGAAGSMSLRVAVEALDEGRRQRLAARLAAASCVLAMTAASGG